MPDRAHPKHPQVTPARFCLKPAKFFGFPKQPHIGSLKIHRPRRKGILLIVLVLAVLASISALLVTYHWSLSPVDSSSNYKVRVIVEKGETVIDIAHQLKQAGLIKSEASFRIYSELTNTKNHLQAGAYALSKNFSVADIIDHLSTGRTDEFNLRVVPGLTLKQQYDGNLQGSFAQQGFSSAEIDKALAQNYASDLLAKRPAGSTLEGYIYPDTYRVTADSDLSVVIEKSLVEFAKVIQDNDIESKLAAHGLTLHRGITMASIVQKEASNEQDQRQIA